MTPLNSIFCKKCRFIAGAQTPEQIPSSSKFNMLPEIAFVGRSNVGKSSLINALTQIDGLAKTSKTPGRTQQINFFSLNEKIILTDLPGYGYANVSKKMRNDWDSLINGYLHDRSSLARVFLLIDSRRGLMDSDKWIMSIMDHIPIVYQIIMTKTDKITNLEKEIDNIHNETKNLTAIYPKIIPTSVKTNLGIKDMQKEVLSILG